MFSYLAEAGLQHHLANLPNKAELAGPKIRGELGKQTLDFGTLSEPPHRIFANWPSTSEGVLEFTRKYGLLDPNGRYSRDWDSDKPRSFSLSVAKWIEYQKYFQQYWSWNKKHSDWEVVKHDLLGELTTSTISNAPSLSHPGVELDYILELGPKPIVLLSAQTLWQYFLLLLAFHSVGELRSCQNPDCPAPRFIARRRNQMFCNSDCAALLAKRRWWANHGEKWRKDRSKSTKHRKRKS